MMKYDKLGQFFFFFNRTVKSQVFEFILDMAEPVDEEKLKTALDQTLRLFPDKGARPVISEDKKSVIMEPNPLPPLIFHEEGQVGLGSDENNGYLFRCIVLGKQLRISMFHALGDGHGAMVFVYHIVWYYLNAMGHEIRPGGLLMTPEEVQSYDATADMEKKLADYGITERKDVPGRYSPEQVFHDPGQEELFSSAQAFGTVLRLPLKPLMELLHTYEVTPLVFFHVLFSQAIREVSDVGDKVIDTSYAVDMRKRLHSRYLCDFGSLGDMFYTPQMEQLPLEEQLRLAKEERDAWVNGEDILYTAKNIAAAFDDVAPYADFTMLEAMQPMIEKSRRDKATVFFSNNGRIPFSEDMLPFIRDFNVHFLPSGTEINVGFHSYKDHFYMCVFDNSTDPAVVDALREKLSGLGLASEIIFRQTFVQDYLGKLRQK